MSVLETFRMLIDGELMESESITPYRPTTVRSKDIRPAHRVAAVIEAGQI
jgi:hypothetical protein